MKQWAGLRVAGLTFGTTAVVLLANVLGSVVLARSLGPEGRGALAALLFWPHLLAGLGNLSINDSLVKRIAGTPSQIHRHYLGVSLTVTLVLAVATVILGAVFMPILLGANRAGMLEATTWYLVLFVPISMVGVCLLSYQQGLLNFDRFNQLRFVQPSFYIAGLLMLVLSGTLTVETVALVTLLSTVAGTVLSWWSAARPLPAWRASTALHLGTLGVQYHGVNLVMFVANEIDRLVVLSWTGDQEVGIYAVATAVAMLGTAVIGQTAAALLFPKIAALAEDSQRRELFCRSSQLTVLFTVAVNAVAALMVPLLVPLVFGPAFEAAVPVTQMLLIAHGIRTVRNVVDRSLRASGVASGGAMSELVTIVVFVVSAASLFESFGLIGMAVALSFAQAAGLLMLGVTVYLRLGLIPTQWVVPRIAAWRELGDILKRIRRR